MAALKDVSRRWHVPPAFSVEFVGYYLERNSRVTSLRTSLERLTKENEKLLGGEEKLRSDYDEVSGGTCQAGKLLIRGLIGGLITLAVDRKSPVLQTSTKPDWHPWWGIPK